MPLTITLKDGLTLDAEAAFYLAKEREFLDNVLGFAIFSKEFCHACECHYRSIVAIELARAGDLQAQLSLLPSAYHCVTSCDNLLLRCVVHAMPNPLILI